MRHDRVHVLSILVALGAGILPAVHLSGCATERSEGFDGTDDAGAEPSGDAATTPLEVDAGTIPGDGGTGFGTVSDDAEAPREVRFYAHDNAALYSVAADDPEFALSKIGAFDCVAQGGGAGTVTSMTDIAVDQNGRLFGVAKDTLFLDMKIDGDKVRCAQSSKTIVGAKSTVFYGASFAPVGTLGDSANETLILGNTAGELYAADTSTGQITLVGTLGTVPQNDGRGHAYVTTHVGKAWALSGDVVFLSNKGNPVGFATVRDCKTPATGVDCSRTDTLLEIDLSKLSKTSPGVVTRAVRGQIVKATGCNDPLNDAYGNMFGIAAYQGDILGFSKDGFIVRIDNNRGAACLIADHVNEIDRGFAGAGVTTIAPVIAPPR
ncbi:MAG: hypothetical protein U0169_09505 [Polyangiaceae bacterium]